MRLGETCHICPCGVVSAERFAFEPGSRFWEQRANCRRASLKRAAAQLEAQAASKPHAALGRMHDASAAGVYFRSVCQRFVSRRVKRPKGKAEAVGLCARVCHARAGRSRGPCRGFVSAV